MSPKSVTDDGSDEVSTHVRNPVPGAILIDETMMDQLTYRIVKRLQAPGSPLSRNRHYSVFDTPEGRRALRIHKRVRGVEADLLVSGGGAEVSLEPQSDELVRLEIEIPHLRARRVSLLTRAELDILRETRAGRLLEDSSPKS